MINKTTQPLEKSDHEHTTKAHKEKNIKHEKVDITTGIAFF